MTDPTNPGGQPPREDEPTPGDGSGTPQQPTEPPTGPVPDQPAGPPASTPDADVPPASPYGPGGAAPQDPAAPPSGPPAWGAPQEPAAPPSGPPAYGAPGAYGAPAGAPGDPTAPGPTAPPSGAYPPPSGSYPPPPGSYPVAAGGYGAQPGYTGPAFAVGEAISYGWRKVTSNLGPWILVALIFIAVNVAWSWITGGFDQFQDQYDFTDTNFAAVSGITFTSILLGIVGTVIGYLITAFFTRGALHEVDGRRPDVAAFFRIGNVVNVLLAALIVGILTGVGLVLCILPGLAVLLFSAFVYYVALDQGVDAITAIRTSFSLVAKNFGQVFLLLLALVGINILGAIPCGLGLFVTIPLSYVAVGFAYRRLTGGVPAV
ncbi:hypothetical protein [Cellulosimicrobium protaetiae]|uniref:Integral membrane protein n=1 Tax=Cellulosimicrobium protaetiae TaxID=2587808 RepID=A0A6M5UEH8_9MICO|nr:hypothetical protein [Cellulosimicrobium protaetiae]QJW36424.1 hypothetical protein FIC82_009705 [Cellulosimicrobium protaetiae]